MSKMTLGAEPKKVAILAGLLVVAGYLAYTNFGLGESDAPSTPGPRATSPTGPRAAPAKPTGLPDARDLESPAFARGRQQRQGDFKPSLRPRKPEERLDPMTVDPTLRTDLLQRLANVRMGPLDRSLFDMGAATPEIPKQVEPKIAIKPVKVKKMVGPEPPPPPPAPVPPPPKPQAPPVPLKFYGYQVVRAEGVRRTFCLDGEDILIPKEGDTVKGRYKIVRIGLTSVVVEDLQFKQQQTLPIEEADKAGQGG